jgi:copper(I)-binding protein
VFARRTTSLLAAALLPLAVSACGSGLDPQTYRERTTQDAANTTVGPLALRDVAILPPASGAGELAVGTDATATLAVVSTAGQSDTLTSVSSPAAASVDLVNGSGGPLQQVQVPAGGSLSSSDFKVVLHGLVKPLRPGMYVDMTFAFANNGSTTFPVPVKVYDNPLPRASFSPQAPRE